MDRKTVRKFIDMEDFNEPAPESKPGQRFCPKLDDFKPTIDKWLTDDRKAPRKQRHTAKRVFDRLKEKYPDTFDCSYRTVAAYYAVRRKEVIRGEQNGFMPLEHCPGDAQVDFGTADFYENGTHFTGKYLELSFPHSNNGYTQLNYGENAECLLEGLDAIFRHMGCVPERLWFDNTKTIVTKILRGGGRELTERYQRFREHYGFKDVFTNPGKGNEKGNVENKVGYSRRNFLVPVPSFKSLEEFNRQLLETCDKDSVRDHYRRNSGINELFRDDLEKCHPLPVIPFDLSGHLSVKTNSWGKFYLNNGLHEYSASPAQANTTVNLTLTSSHVLVLDENFREIVRHRRLYGDLKQQSMEWLPYLKLLSMRPRALKYSGIYDMMPGTLKQFLEGCNNSEVGKVLKVLSTLTDRTGFESAIATVEQALTYGAADADSINSLYRRIYSDMPELPPMHLDSGVLVVEQMSASLSEYDAFLVKGGGIHA